MKKIAILFTLVFVNISILLAQAPPQGINYQAVVYSDHGNNQPGLNVPGQVLRNKNIKVRFTIIQNATSGSEVYKETHSTTTDAFGMFSLVIGQGTQVGSIAFSGINWGAGKHFLKVEIDKNAGSNFVTMSNQQLLSVPYALYADKSTYSTTSGNGIVSVSDNGNGTLTFTYFDGSTYTTPVLTGLQGPQGIQGPAGQNGTNGVNGTNGANGQNGLSAYEIWLAEGNTGTESDFLNAITGPQGVQGMQGDVGQNGLNAYEVWLAQGNIGTEQDFLTAITGPQGLLLNGTSVGNTPFWNGTNWVINNSNIFNNGSEIGVGTSTPNSSAKLEIASTNQGFLPPRMTNIQRNEIINPANGLMIFNISSGCPNYFFDGVWHEWCGTATSLYPLNSVFCSSQPTSIVNVLNPTTGKIWMDRNIGATQAAISSTDINSYGDLYQWGRFSDGHQCRSSLTNNSLSSIIQPPHGNFILSPISPHDWLSPQNNSLWLGVNGANNPCPTGYRIPTESEFISELTSWTNNNANGAFTSPLKLSLAGERIGSNGNLFFVGSYGYYWSSTISGNFTKILQFDDFDAIINSDGRSGGNSVRCIKD